MSTSATQIALEGGGRRRKRCRTQEKEMCSLILQSLIRATIASVGYPNPRYSNALADILEEVLVNWRDDHEKVMMRHKFLGRGGLGTVFAFKGKKGRTPFVGKHIERVPMEFVRIRGKVSASQEREMIIQTLCAAIGISVFPVAMLHVNKKHTNSVMIMESLPPGQTVTKFVKQHWRDAEAMTWLRQNIIESVAQMHAINIMHGDLHGDNMYVTDKGKLLILDFGRSVQLETPVMHQIGKMMEYMIMSDDYAKEGIFNRWADASVMKALWVPAASNKTWLRAMKAVQIGDTKRFATFPTYIRGPIDAFLQHHASMLNHLSDAQKRMMLFMQADGMELIVVAHRCSM